MAGGRKEGRWGIEGVDSDMGAHQRVWELPWRRGVRGGGCEGKGAREEKEGEEEGKEEETNHPLLPSTPTHLPITSLPSL